MRTRIFGARMGFALALALGVPGFSSAAEPDSAAVEAPPPPPAKRARLSAPT